MISPAEYNALLRQDFNAFIHRSFRELNPTTPFLSSWHVELVAAKLEECRTGKINRLIINMPPRSLKSHAASVAFPAFLLGHNPSAQIICASYGEELAAKHSLDCRNLMSSRWYRNLFSTRLSAQKQSAQEFVTTNNGFRLATSVGGMLTGRGCDFAIIDDPMKPEEALSETFRNAANEWFSHTLYSRLNNKQTGCIIIVMQRLHQDDLVGHVLEHEDWEVVRMAAIAEEDESHVIRTPYRTRVVKRNAGEALHPDREPLPVLDRIRRSVGEYNFAAQYQQRPAPIGGGMVKIEWFRTYAPAEQPSEFDLILQSWDTAAKSTELSDYSVCTTWGIKRPRLYLLDVYRERLEYPDLKRNVIRLAELHRARTILIEDRSSGTQLIQDLIRDGLSGVTGYKTTLDKIMRLHSVTSTIENGFVFVPTAAPWLADFLQELSTFPAAKYDDQTDSTSQALDWVKTGMQCYGVLDYYRSEAEKSGLVVPPRQSEDNCGDRLAIQNDTGRKIRWNGRSWIDVNTGETYSSGSFIPNGFTAFTETEPCPLCGSKLSSRIASQKRCAQCGHQWPPVVSGIRMLTRKDILSGGAYFGGTRHMRPWW